MVTNWLRNHVSAVWNLSRDRRRLAGPHQRPLVRGGIASQDLSILKLELNPERSNVSFGQDLRWRP